MTRHPQLVERIHAAAKPLVLAVTGGGSGAIVELLSVPGASASVLEAVVPYSASALADWLGGSPDQACSEATARAMAMASFERARQLCSADPRTLRGVGATASLTTNRPKRGARRIHVAWQSATTSVVVSHDFGPATRGRKDEEQVAAELVLQAVAEACGVGGETVDLPLRRRAKNAPPAWSELLLGERTGVWIDEPGREFGRGNSIHSQEQKTGALFPGAFNPVHEGHQRMANVAAERLGVNVTWELSLTNVDKPPLDFIEIADRVAGLAGRRVLLTRATTFDVKAELAAGCTFVIGADTLGRIADPKYYGGNAARRDAAIAAIAAQGCRFLVFGRNLRDQFCQLRDLEMPAPLRALCDEVAETEFRHDGASSRLRAETQRSPNPAEVE